MGSLVPWPHRNVFLRKESVDRLVPIRRAIRRVVASQYPPAGTRAADEQREKKRDRARRLAERRVLDVVIRRILDETSTFTLTRQYFDRVMRELPRLHNLPGSYLDFETGLTEWRDLEFQFSQLRKTRNGASEMPEYAVLGYALAKLTDDDILQIVTEGCSTIKDLKEASRCLVPAVAS